MAENNKQSQNIPKTPLIGLLITLIGIIIFISSFFTSNSSGVKVESVISYASILKPSLEDPSVKTQSINVIYEYQNKKYETGIRDIVDGKYKKSEKIIVYINPKNPTEITLKQSSNNKTWFVGVIFVVCGIVVFIGLFDPVIAFIKAFITNDNTNKNTSIQKLKKEKSPRKKLNIKEIIDDANSGVRNTIDKIIYAFKKKK